MREGEEGKGRDRGYEKCERETDERVSAPGDEKAEWWLCRITWACTYVSSAILAV